jgi:hypothetical protein
MLREPHFDLPADLPVLLNWMDTFVLQDSTDLISDGVTRMGGGMIVAALPTPDVVPHPIFITI